MKKLQKDLITSSLDEDLKVVGLRLNKVGGKLDEGSKEEYEKFFKSALKKFGVSSPSELDDKKKKEFFNYVDDNWKAKDEDISSITKENLKEIIREEVQLLTEATRWNVGLELPNGKVIAVYGHWDGYPDYVGKILKKHYSNPSKIKQLLKLGKQGISSLGQDIKGGKDHDFANPKKGQTIFYGRDRGDKGDFGMIYKSKDEYGNKKNRDDGSEFAYVYSMNDKKWTYFDYHGNEKDL